MNVLLLIMRSEAAAAAAAVYSLLLGAACFALIKAKSLHHFSYFLASFLLRKSVCNRRRCTSALDLKEAAAGNDDKEDAKETDDTAVSLSMSCCLPLPSLFFSSAPSCCPYHLRQIRRQLYNNNIYLENMLERALKCCQCAKVIKIFSQLQF